MADIDQLTKYRSDTIMHAVNAVIGVSLNVYYLQAQMMSNIQERKKLRNCISESENEYNEYIDHVEQNDLHDLRDCDECKCRLHNIINNHSKKLGIRYRNEEQKKSFNEIKEIVDVNKHRNIKSAKKIID